MCVLIGNEMIWRFLAKAIDELCTCMCRSTAPNYKTESPSKDFVFIRRREGK